MERINVNDEGEVILKAKKKNKVALQADEDAIAQKSVFDNNDKDKGGGKIMHKETTENINKKKSQNHVGGVKCAKSKNPKVQKI